MNQFVPITAPHVPALVAVALLAFAAPARAAVTGPMTVADLQEFCTSSDEGSKTACRFYIYGVVQGARLAAGAAGDTTHFCIPDDLPAAAMEAVIKRAIGHDLMFFPADRDLEASGFIGAVLQKTFPCSMHKPKT